MGTSNFETQKHFDLYATDIFEIEYIDENDEPIGKWGFDDYYFNECKKFINKLNDELRFFNITLENGYYSGIQTYIVDKSNFEAVYYLDHSELWFAEEIFEEFGVNKYIFNRMIQSEVNKINNKILPLLKEWGFDRYGVIAKFSNGETFYSKY